MTVGKIIEEEVHTSFQSAQWGSKLSEMEEWTERLPSKLLAQSFTLAHGVAEASFQMTREWRWEKDVVNVDQRSGYVLRGHLPQLHTLLSSRDVCIVECADSINSRDET